MLAVFPCGRQVYFFILPRRKQSFSGILKLPVQTGDKQLSSVDILGSLIFSLLAFHTVFMTPYIFCGSSGVIVLLSSGREGSSADELQLALWTALVAIPAEEEKFINEM